MFSSWICPNISVTHTFHINNLHKCFRKLHLFSHNMLCLGISNFFPPGASLDDTAFLLLLAFLHFCIITHWTEPKTKSPHRVQRKDSVPTPTKKNTRQDEIKERQAYLEWMTKSYTGSCTFLPSKMSHKVEMMRSLSNASEQGDRGCRRTMTSSARPHGVTSPPFLHQNTANSTPKWSPSSQDTQPNYQQLRHRRATQTVQQRCLSLLSPFDPLFLENTGTQQGKMSIS